jgi:hypothetical protein
MDSYRGSRAIEEITIEVLASREKIGKSTDEVKEIVRQELEKYGVEKALAGSTLLWINYIKGDLVSNVLNRLA